MQTFRWKNIAQISITEIDISNKLQTLHVTLSWKGYAHLCETLASSQIKWEWCFTLRWVNLGCLQEAHSATISSSSQAREGNKMETTWLSLTPSSSLLPLLSLWVAHSPYTAGMGLWPVLPLLTHFFCYTAVIPGDPCSGSCLSHCSPHPPLPGRFCSSLHRPSLRCCWRALLCLRQRVRLSFLHNKSYNIGFPLIMGQGPCTAEGKTRLQLLTY